MEMRDNADRVGVEIQYTGDDFFIHKSRLKPKSWWRGGLWNPQDMEVFHPAGFPGRLHFDVVQRANTNALCGIADTITNRRVFHFPERYAEEEADTEWDGRFLLVQSRSGETMILDFDPICPR